MYFEFRSHLNEFSQKKIKTNEQPISFFVILQWGARSLAQTQSFKDMNTISYTTDYISPSMFSLIHIPLRNHIDIF